MAPKSSIRSFTREFKLKAIHSCYDNGKNAIQAFNKFKVDRKQIRNLVKSEELIQKQNRTSRSTQHGKLMFPVMERELYKRFIYTRKEGQWIKRWWFNTQAKQIMIEIYPEHVETFKISARWFAGFCRRNNISLRRETHASQKTSQQLRKLISELHAKTMRERR